MTSLDAFGQAAECLRTIAHPFRLRILQLLLRGEHTVGELAEACGVASPIASEHLGRLRDRGLLTRERRGRKVYYAVAEPALGSILNCIETRFGAATDPPGRSTISPKRGRRKASTG